MRGIKILNLCCFIVCVLFMPLCALSAKNSYEMRDLFIAMAQQLTARIKTENSPEAAFRQQVIGQIDSSLFSRFVKAPSLRECDPEIQFGELTKALGKYFYRFNILDLADNFAENGASFEKFYAGLKTLGARRNIILNWEQPHIKEAAMNLYRTLQGVHAKKLCLSARSHFSSEDWNGEIRFSYYPTYGNIYLYAVVTFTRNTAVRTVIVNGSGKVFLGGAKPHDRTVKLSKYSMDMSMRKVEASGHWSQPNAKNGDGSGSLFIDVNSRLRINGGVIEGRVIESIIDSGGSGIPVSVEYVLSGSSDAAGNMKGRCTVRGEPGAIKLRLGGGAKVSWASWTASFKNGAINGVINIEGAPAVLWQASVNK
ncbi:hypothetical protein IJT93_08445 [bacterium]|nr:hypothetical protein [bacterium]